MKIIFDFDYTLFDAKRFEKDLADIFNISEENFLSFCQREFKAKGVNYSLDKHLAVLTKKGKLMKGQEEKIKADFNVLLDKLDEYIFPDVKNILHGLKDAGHKLYLITFGDAGWQEKKITKTKLAGYFDKIVYEEQNKNQSEFLLELKKRGGKILIINDNFNEGLEMQKVLGETSELHLVAGPYSGSQEKDEKIIPFTVHKNLREVFTKLKFIKPEKIKELKIK